LDAVKYGFGRTIDGRFAEGVARIKEAFKEQGFGTLCEIDVQATLKEKIGAEIEPYTILGMCNPSLAQQAIGAEHQIGLLLPCNVLVHECGGTVRVEVQDPELMVGVTGNARLESVAREARRRLMAALDGL
jgi:uncharacterized protein (DUF302 family)